MTASVPRRPRPKKIDTERIRAMRASARHLTDLKRAHSGPPAEVRVCMTRTPRFIAPVAENSYCTSPALLCAELVK